MWCSKLQIFLIISIHGILEQLPNARIVPKPYNRTPTLHMLDDQIKNPLAPFFSSCKEFSNFMNYNVIRFVCCATSDLFHFNMPFFCEKRGNRSMPMLLVFTDSPPLVTSHLTLDPRS